MYSLPERSAVHTIRPYSNSYECSDKLPFQFVDSEAIKAVSNLDGRIQVASPKFISETVDFSKTPCVRTNFKQSKAPAGSIIELDVSEDYAGVITTQADPSLLLEYNASFCSLLLSFDYLGNAVLMHDPYVGAYGTGIDDEIVLRNLTAYREKVYENLNLTQVNLVMGMNAFNQNDEERYTKFMQLMSDVFVDGWNEPILIKPQHSPYIQRSFPQRTASTLDKRIRNIYKPNPYDDINEVSGVVFVPRYLSNDNLNHVMLISDTTGLNSAIFPGSK